MSSNALAAARLRAWKHPPARATHRMVFNQKYHSSVEGLVDVLRVQHDGSEVLLASGLHPAEVDGLREWFCYTKPIGRGMKIVLRPTSEKDSTFTVLAAGTEPDLPEVECVKATAFVATGPIEVRDGGVA